MKILKSKTFWASPILYAAVFVSRKMTTVLSDNLQREIYADEVRIIKPKKWIPILVDREEKRLLFNLVNTSRFNKVIPFTVDEEFTSSILLQKDTDKIFIQGSSLILDDKTEKNYRKFVYLSKIYYIKEREHSEITIIHYPQNGLCIVMSSFDKDLLNEICSHKHYK